MLRRLMFKELKTVLDEIQNLCRSANPLDWPLVYLSFCAILFAAESMAVDVYKHGPEQAARSSVKQIEEQSLLHILGYLRMSTGAQHPLDLDWRLSGNMSLLNQDMRSVFTMRALQKLRETNSELFCMDPYARKLM